MAQKNSTGFQQAKLRPDGSFPVRAAQFLYLPLQIFALTETMPRQAPDGAVVKAAKLIGFRACAEQNRTEQEQ